MMSDQSLLIITLGNTDNIGLLQYDTHNIHTVNDHSAAALTQWMFNYRKTSVLIPNSSRFSLLTTN